MRLLLSILILSASLTSGYTQIPQSKLVALSDSIRNAHGIPGLATAVVTIDTTILAWNGHKRTDHSFPIESNSKFHLGSNTKAFTAFIALDLIDQGLLQLNTKFFTLFPELKINSQKEYHSITLQQLLQHEALIQPFTSGVEFESLPPMNGSPSQNRYHFASVALSMKPADPNTYSNAGYGIASLMLEKVTGKSYENLVEELCARLNLDYFIGLPNRQDSSGVWGHWMENETLVALPPDHTYNLPDYLAAAGDISMSIEDYAKWIQIQVKGACGQDEILDSNAYRLMHFSGSSHGLGWGNQREPVVLSYHDGTTGTFYAHAIVIPGLKSGIAILTNSAEKTHVSAIYALREAIIAEILKNRKN